MFLTLVLLIIMALIFGCLALYSTDSAEPKAASETGGGTAGNGNVLVEEGSRGGGDEGAVEKEEG